MEKGSQGNNAKFTYSCDGHSAYADLNFSLIYFGHVEQNLGPFIVFGSDISYMCAASNYLSSQGYTFLAVADEAYGRTIPFAFVEKVRDEWFAKWADKGASASAHSLDKSFGYVMVAIMYKKRI